MPRRMCLSAMLVLVALAAAPGYGADKAVGALRTVIGGVIVERGGARIAALPGMALYEADRIVTRSDGSAGISLQDDTLLALGPSSHLAIDRFVFDHGAGSGLFESTLGKGTLAVIAGKVAKRAPETMKLRTPNAILGVRGTEFVVEVDARH